MCVISMIGDHFRETIPQKYPWAIQTDSTYPPVTPSADVTREEFDALCEDIKEMKALLIRAKLYDEANGEPDCEMDEKVALLKQIANLVGVDLHEVFGDR